VLCACVFAVQHQTVLERLM